jgi:hypothetical protein
MTDTSPAPFKVVYLPAAMQALRAMTQRAIARNLAKELAGILRAVDDRLRNDPVNWGEPVRRLKSGIVMHGRAISTLYFSYAVDEQRNIVMVDRVTPFTGSPYEEPT